MSWLHSPRDVGGWEFTEDFALRTQTGFAIILGLTAIVTCFRTYSVLLILVSLIQLLIATAMWQMADGFQIVSPWISASIAKLLPYLAQGGRVAAPLVLLLYDRRDREPLAAW